jgi:beta-lactam-binding protein with PASTA domain
VPDVNGKQLARAVADVRAAGFGNVQPGRCTEDPAGDPAGKATASNPAAGTVTNRNSAITVDYTSRDCTP